MQPRHTPASRPIPLTAPSTRQSLPPSIRGRLTRINMLTSTTAVLLTCLGLTITGLLNVRKRMTADLSMISQVVGTNTTAALAKGDRQAARAVLNTLRAKPSIVAAAIYTKQGELFARYEPTASVSVPRVLQPDGFYDRPDRLELFYEIRFQHERLGTLYVASDARDRNARLKEYAAIAGGIGLFSLLVAYVLAAALQGSISKPIVELARIAGLIARERNFHVRASPFGANGSAEIANLVAGFNSMLAEIEQRDLEMALDKTELEMIVALRTEELLAAKNAAEQTAAINAKLASESALILNSSNDGIFGVDLDSEPTFLNPAGSRMLGRSLAELQGASMHQLIHHSRPDGTPWPEAECHLGTALLRGESFMATDDTFWRPDGTCFPVEYSATPMFNESGNRLGAVVTFRDVTERKAVERLKSEFVSTVSHELRTPLTSIRGALGLLGSGLLGPIEEKSQRMLQIAVSNTDRLVRLINDILDLERMGSGNIELSHRAFDAHSVMLQASEGVQPVACQAGVRIVVEPVSAALLGDSDRIIQTLTNLLGNAIKFSPRDTTVTLSAIANGSELVFCVSDQGRGIPEEKLESIFERFSQVDASDSRDKGGSGLGLAICQSIVHAHGGRIWAEKNEPAGSRFQFTIPLAVASTVNAEKDDLARPVDIACSEPTVLVVEDDLDLARVMTTSLQNHGIRTLHAPNGKDAIQLSTQHMPSLIVLDPGLPDISGFEVVDALRQNAALTDIPILVYSALEVGSADRLRLGATEFLTKSRCTPAEFERHVMRLIAAVTSGRQHAA